MSNIRAAIIGAGSIGAWKESKFDSVGGKNIFTHAHAFTEHPQIELIGIVDEYPLKAERAGEKWSCPAFDSISKLAQYEPEIVSICTPTETHLEVFREVSEKLNPKLVILEKPCGMNLEECKEIAASKIPVMVNYSRNFNHHYHLDLDVEFYSARLLYTRGFRHEACHALNLFNRWFGKFLSGSILPRGFIADRDYRDPSIPVYLQYEKCPSVVCLPMDGRKYSVFDIEIVTDKGIMHFKEHGDVYEFEGLEDSIYGDYQALGGVSGKLKTGMNHNLFNMADNAVNFIREGAPLLCTAKDALEIHKVYRDLKLS